MTRLDASLLLSCVLFLAGCKGGSSPGVFRNVNASYSRTSSHVLAREVTTPTRARLDYAAYAANVMLWDEPARPVRLSQAPKREAAAFGGLLSDFRKTPADLPLASAEREAPLHWKPALDFLLEQDFASARAVAEAYGQVLAASWGFEGDAPPLLEFAELYLSAKDSSAWVKLEWKPWALPAPEDFGDADADGFPEAYARIDPSVFTPALFARLRGEYSTRVLSETEVLDYGHQLAAYWYPSRNTDFKDLRGTGPWPGKEVEADIRGEMKGADVSQPLFALRGKPHGRPMYFIVSVPGLGAQRPEGPAGAAEASGRAVADNLDEYLSSIRDRETSLLEEAGKGSWKAWTARLAPFHRDVSALLQSRPASVMAFKGKGDFLIFRRELEYLLADDLQKLPPQDNPLETIVALRDSLASLGIDFLFVPVPTKQDVHPDLVSRAGANLPGGVAQPYFRKMLLDLSERGVETVDLLSLFQDLARADKEPLYQRQDTHWNPRGLAAAAGAVSERVMSYAWFGEAYPEEIQYVARDSTFGQLGDLHGRLPADERSAIGPEELVAERVFTANGGLYRDSPDAPVLVLGDSYTGVFQLTGCRNAGVTAHLAKAIGGPVDLIMGWGGGPEAPNKLRHAGPEALKGKRLVIWMMSARDLFVYPGGWKR
jgi:hypothetical protein